MNENEPQAASGADIRKLEGTRVSHSWLAPAAGGPAPARGFRAKVRCPPLRHTRRPCATLSLPPAASSTPLVHHWVPQLKSNPTKFQYAISVPGTQLQYAISVRLKLNLNEQDKKSACFQSPLSSVGVGRAERTLLNRRVPPSSLIPTTACLLSFRPWPATACPYALRPATLLRGAGLQRSRLSVVPIGARHLKSGPRCPW